MQEATAIAFPPPTFVPSKPKKSMCHVLLHVQAKSSSPSSPSPSSSPSSQPPQPPQPTPRSSTLPSAGPAVIQKAMSEKADMDAKFSQIAMPSSPAARGNSPEPTAPGPAPLPTAPGTMVSVFPSSGPAVIEKAKSEKTAMDYRFVQLCAPACRLPIRTSPPRQSVLPGAPVLPGNGAVLLGSDSDGAGDGMAASVQLSESVYVSAAATSQVVGGAGGGTMSQVRVLLLIQTWVDGLAWRFDVCVLMYHGISYVRGAVFACCFWQSNTGTFVVHAELLVRARVWVQCCRGRGIEYMVHLHTQRPSRCHHTLLLHSTNLGGAFDHLFGSGAGFLQGPAKARVHSLT